MKRICLTILISLLVSANIVIAQNISLQRHSYGIERTNDLPVTQIKSLDNVIAKATTEKAYGVLLKAMIERMELRHSISPDSLITDVKLLESVTDNTNHNSAIYAVYNSVIGSIYREMSSMQYRNNALREEYNHKSHDFFIRSLSNPQITADVSTREFYPFFSKNKGTSLLVSLAYNANMFEVARDYYVNTNNRPYALIMSLEALNKEGDYNDNYLHQLDSLISCYGDINECCMVATAKYRYLSNRTNISNDEKIKFVRESLSKWGSYEGATELKNAELTLTRPSFEVVLTKSQVAEGDNAHIILKDVRNVNKITTTIWKTNLTTADIAVKKDEGLLDNNFYQDIINGLKKKDAIKITSRFDAPDYKYSHNEFDIPSLQRGIYIIENSSNTKDMPSVYTILYVSNLFVISESLPHNKLRLAVVDIKDGKPISNAPLTVYYRKNYKERDIENIVTDNKGEVLFQNNDRPYAAFASTDSDQFMPLTAINNTFGFHDNNRNNNNTIILTDRSIYRPGQTVKVAIVAYQDIKGKDMKVDSAATINITLKDANHKVVAQKTVTTDAYGSASTEFTLPTKTLNGRFTITDSRNGYTSIRVEEYKRPTFDVVFDDPKIQYRLGDTIRVDAHASSFTGAPLHNAKVSYSIKRSWYPWLRYFMGNGGEVIANGTTTTSNDGSFSVDVPLTALADNRKGCYSFVVDAYVTDTTGETQNGQLLLKASNKEVWIDCNLPEKIEKSELSTIYFTIKNISNKDIDTDVTFFIDNTKGYIVQSNTYIDFKRIMADVPSGRHKITITAMDEKIEREFVMFSLDDKQLAYETNEWFYLTSDTFPTDGSGVSIQVGSSLNDVHVFYTLLSGNNILKMGTAHLDNEIKTYTLKYKEEYGNGILINYAWVKDGELYSRKVEIKKALPKKKLHLRWTTFRNRLTPGQNESWTLNISNDDNTPADASVVATLYDKSLDNIISHSWNSIYGLHIRLPYTDWYGTYSNNRQSVYSIAELQWYTDKGKGYEMFPEFNLRDMYVKGSGYVARNKSAIQTDVANSRTPQYAVGSDLLEEEESASTEDVVINAVPQLRENLSETAFFYPALTTDKEGNVNIAFTLPESTTTWKFMAFAHDKGMSNNVFTDEVIANKKVMIQPDMPRFVRRGDKATISARITNLSCDDISGKAVMQLCDAETEKVIIGRSANFAISKEHNDAVSFSFDVDIDADFVICKIFAQGDNFSDGEQHYLNILSDRELITNTSVLTLKDTGTLRPNINRLFGDKANDRRFTLEYTDNPLWFVIQALPFITETKSDDAISTATKIYANVMARNIATASPETKKTIDSWNTEDNKSLLKSNLQMNALLKDIALEESPWITAAESETERMQRVTSLFDENITNNNINDAINVLRLRQLDDGSWAWWEGMNGSKYVTLTVTEMLVRLEKMTKGSNKLTQITDKAMAYLANEMVKYQDNKKTKHVLNDSDIRYLYLKALRNDKRYSDTDNILMKELKECNTSDLTIYGKAMASIIFNKTGNKDKALHLIKSIKEYSVYRDDMGRYFDTNKALYSWYDYKIPTQVMVIEALQDVTPNDSITIAEMQQWLIQEKRTTSWDTPINAVNAIYALTKGGLKIGSADNNTEIKINGKIVTPILPGMGYVMSSAEGDNFDVTINKRNNGFSWLSLYGSYTSDIKDINALATGLSIRREIIAVDNTPITVGSKVKVRLTITADRDYDFVQITDKRAACMEPVNQISGYNGRYYCSMKDNVTHYFFDMMPKGTHVIETEYYIDRHGSYTTGTCKIQCAYAPAFKGRTSANTIRIK